MEQAALVQDSSKERPSVERNVQFLREIFAAKSVLVTGDKWAKAERTGGPLDQFLERIESEREKASERLNKYALSSSFLPRGISRYDSWGRG